MEEKTPKDLTSKLNLKNAYFDDVHDFTRYINQTSREFRVPYSSYQTGDSRKYQVFKCRFGGRVSENSRFSAKSDCPSFLKYAKDGNYYTLIDANFSHNHTLDPLYVEGHSNCISNDIMLKINEEQVLSVPPGQIRQHYNILASSDIFYNSRRKSISIAKQESIDDLISYLEKINFKSKIIRNNISGNLEDIYIINQKISKKPFAMFLLFIDDTAKTNTFGLPLEMIVSKDPEGLNQCLAFGVLLNKTISSFESFFSELKNELGEDPKGFVVDRSLSQYTALKNIFPNSHIMFCLRHLGKDLLKYFPSDSDIVKGFYSIQKDIGRCFEYINFLKNIYDSLETGNELIKWMITYEENWLPIHLIEFGNLYDWTTNRVEGFFGNFKLHNNFKIFKLLDLIKGLVNYCQLQMTQSYKKRNKNYKYKDFCNFEEEDVERIGSFALDKICNEIICSRAGEEIQFCLLCILRNHSQELSLPCRHIFNEQPDFHVSWRSISPIYLRENFSYSPNGSFSQVYKESLPSNSYSDLMAEISPFASIAMRNERVSQILQKTISELKETCSISANGMPNNFSIKGKISVHPAKNVVLSGKPKTKYIYRCSNCGEPGHNIKTCPKKFK